MNKRALMLIRDDQELQSIADECNRNRDELNRRIGDYEKEVRACHEAFEKFRQDALARVEARVKALNIAFSKKHELSFNPSEGVVWLETKDEEQCSCPFCQLGSLFGGRR